MTFIRINKYLAQTGSCSRRKADELIERGWVTINGRQAQKGDKVQEQDIIKIQGETKQPQKEKYYFAFHKPYGVITTLEKMAKNSVKDYVETLHLKTRLFPIGRLDVESTGLLLFTNDGDFSQYLLHAKFGWEKEYLVHVHKPISDEFIQGLKTGVLIGDIITRPAIVKKAKKNQFHIILTEGRNRQIRRMCEVLGYSVTKLKRIRIGPVQLANLPIGAFRPLTQEEKNIFKQKSLVMKKTT